MERKPIVLPLTVGRQATARPPHHSLSTAELEIELELESRVLRSLYSHGRSRVSAVVRHEGQRVVAECGGGEEGCEVELGREGEHILLPPFRVAFRMAHQQLSLRIAKQLINFHLYAVGRARFVKNEQLERVIARGREGKEEWGPLSMDKAERFMLEPAKTAFPAIGLWTNSSQPLTDSAAVSQLAGYLQPREGRRCVFEWEGRSFFYLVRVESGAAEAMVVEWSSSGESEESVGVSRQSAFGLSSVRVGSGGESALEFTLRSDEKVPETLLNIPVSPIRFSSPSTAATPDSPRFRLDHSSLLEQECASLRRLAREQQIEINDLRAELLRVTGELRHCRRARQHDSQELSLASSRQTPLNERPKRLTRSDLNYDDSGVANEETASPNAKEERELEAWERFQIVEPTPQ